jgi:hypothetical protein
VRPVGLLPRLRGHRLRGCLADDQQTVFEDSAVRRDPRRSHLTSSSVLRRCPTMSESTDWPAKKGLNTEQQGEHTELHGTASISGASRSCSIKHRARGAISPSPCNSVCSPCFSVLRPYLLDARTKDAANRSPASAIRAEQIVGGDPLAAIIAARRLSFARHEHGAGGDETAR